MSSTRYTHPRPAANVSISNAILETLRTIEQGTEVHVLLHKLCSGLIGFKCQLLNHFDIAYRQCPVSVSVVLVVSCISP